MPWVRKTKTNFMNTINLEQNPITATDYKISGRGKAKLSDYIEALLDYDKALEIKPDAETLLERGVVKSQNLDYRGAISDFNRSINLNQHNLVAYKARAMAKYHNGNYKSSINDFNLAIEMDVKNNVFSNENDEDNKAPWLFYVPDKIQIFYYRGFSNYLLGRYAEAISDFSIVIDDDPDDKNKEYAVPYCLRGEAKYRLGDYDGALKDYDKAYETNCYGISATALKAQAKFEHGDIIGAFTDYYECITDDPGNHEGRLEKKYMNALLIKCLKTHMFD